MNQHVPVFSLLRVSAPLGHYQEDSSNQDKKRYKVQSEDYF